MTTPQPSKRFFLDITPMISTSAGDRVTLGTVRYELDETQIGSPDERQYYTNTVWLNAPVHGVPADVTFVLSVRSADAPQPQSIPSGNNL